jgi:erythromycin esterase-like protein
MSGQVGRDCAAADPPHGTAHWLLDRPPTRRYVVLLGEATHGTSEFYRARAAITRHLVERNGAEWGAPMEIKSVHPARHGRYEYLFRKTGLARSLTDWRPVQRGELRDALTGARLERAIGVVYRPESEFLSHYFEAVLPEQFDAYVWFEKTQAVAPFPGDRPEGVVESYPFGL